MLAFPSAPPPPPPSRAAPVAHQFIWPQRAPKVDPSRSESSSQLTDFLQKIPKNPPCTLPVHDVVHISWSNFLSGIFILTSLNDTSSPRARQHMRSSLHLTNPCAYRKVLSLTKPKGRIFKTKSLGHCITSLLIKIYLLSIRLEIFDWMYIHTDRIWR